MIKVKNSLNYNRVQKRYEKNSGKSRTIPDQTMSIQEIMKRYATGRPISVRSDGDYDNDEEDILEGRDIRTLDLSEKHDLFDTVKDQIEDLKKPKIKKSAKKADDNKTEDDDVGTNNT